MTNLESPQSSQPLVLRYVRLVADRRFFPYFGAQFLGAFNDNFFKNALILLVTYRFPETPGISRATLVAVASALFTLPFFLCSAQAGLLADRHDKARMAFIVKIAEVLICLFAAIFLFHTGTTALVALFVALIALGVHSAFFGPLKYGILPDLVASDRLLDANALVGGSTFLAILLGTLAGGVASNAGNPMWTTGVPLVVIALLGAFAARAIPPLAARAPSLAVPSNPFAGTFKLLGEALRDRSLRPVYFGVSWFWFLGAGLLSVVAPFCRQTFGDDPRIASVFLAAFSVGIAVGAAISPSIVSFFGRARTLRGAALTMAVGLAVSALLPKVSGQLSILLHFASFVLVAGAGGAYAVPLMAELQLRSSADRRARTIAANNVLNALAMVASSAVLAGLYQLHGGFPVVFGFFALTAGAVSIFLRVDAAKA